MIKYKYCTTVFKDKNKEVTSQNEDKRNICRYI